MRDLGDISPDVPTANAQYLSMHMNLYIKLKVKSLLTYLLEVDSRRQHVKSPRMIAQRAQVLRVEIRGVPECPILVPATAPWKFPPTNIQLIRESRSLQYRITYMDGWNHKIPRWCFHSLWFIYTGELGCLSPWSAIQTDRSINGCCYMIPVIRGSG